MSTVSAQDAGEREAARRSRAERRRILRELHPDRGGDTTEFITALSAMGTRHAAGGLAAPGPPTSANATAWQVLRRRLRRGLQLARTKAPRRWPGARRYAHL